MKVFSGILCALLALLCYITSAEAKTENQCINELNITSFDFTPRVLGGSSNKSCGYNYHMFSDFFIDKLGSGQSKTGYVNSKNGFYVCQNKNQIPTISNVHASYSIEAWRFKTSSGLNGFELISCSENRNNGYFTIKCEKAK